MFQWVWAIALFVSPIYSQPTCSGQTVLMMFLIPIKVADVRGGLNHPSAPYRWSIAIWPLWLVFCLTVSSVYGIILVLRATEFAAEERALTLSRTSTTHTTSTGGGGISLSRTSTSRELHRTDTKKTLWKPFKTAPAPHSQPRARTITKIKWTLQRQSNLFAGRIHVGLRFLRVCVVFLLPPLPNSYLSSALRVEGDERMKMNSRDFRARLRIWIGNAFAVFFVLLFVACESVQSILSIELSGDLLKSSLITYWESCPLIHIPQLLNHKSS